MTDVHPALPDIVPPDERRRWHEMLKISHLVIVLLFVRMRAPRAVNETELAEHLLIDRKTAGKYLHQLSTRNFIAKVGYREGYVLAEGGASMLEKWGKIGHFSLKESFNQDLKDSMIKKEGKNEVGKLWTLPSLDVILSETGKLFEKEVVLFGLQGCDAHLALALLAHAYDQRDQLRAPAVFVYRRLARSLEDGVRTDQYMPDKKYRLDPMAYLPNEYLHAIGLAELQIVEAVEVSDVGNTDEPTEAEQLLQDLADCDQKISAVSVSLTPLSFAQGILKLGVKNEELRDVFQRKLTALINDLLPQLCDVANPCVQFVSVETEG